MPVKRLSFWIIQLVAWGAYGFLTYLSDLSSLAEAQMFSMLGVKLVRAALGMAVSMLLYALYRLIRARLTGIAAIATVAVVASLIASLAWHLLYYVAQAPPWSEAGPAIDWSKFRMEHLEYAFVMLAWSAAYLGAEFWRYSKVQEQTAAEAKALAREAQLQSLSYQLNPHFLFNALNSIRALIQEEPARAREMVTQLSEFLRHTLVSSPLDEIPLREELDVLRRYLRIEQTRFEDRLEVSIDVDQAAAETKVPGFILHPLVENAIKHGMRTSGRPLRVEIRCRLDGDALEVEVANTGVLSSQADRPDAERGAEPDGTGIGLRNVGERLARLYPGRHRFAVAQDGDWVRARLVIAVDRPEPRV